MKLIARLIAAACMFVLTGGVIAPAVQAGAASYHRIGAWDAQTKAAMIGYEKLVDRWAAFLGASTPTWAYIDDDALVCGAVLPIPTGAGYCVGNDTVYVSMDAVRNWEDAGELSQLFIVAHEFGHHLQNLGNPAKATYTADESVAIEDQANCVAGAGIRWVVDSGLLSVTDAAIRQLEMIMFASIGDAMHGSAQAMYDAFVLGEQSGNIEACQAIGVPLAVPHGDNR